jgi:hypothetical protein
MEDYDIIEMPAQEVVISDADESQRNNFYTNVEKYKNTLSLCMQEKTMITIPLYNNIINALKKAKGVKKTGIDIKFYSWCKKHFKIDHSAGVEILCSSKNSNRIAVVENYYKVRPFVLMRQPFETFCFRYYTNLISKQVMVVGTKCVMKSHNTIIGFRQKSLTCFSLRVCHVKCENH